MVGPLPIVIAADASEVLQIEAFARACDHARATGERIAIVVTPPGADTTGSDGPRIEDLSERELDLLPLLVEGLDNSEIAERLGISPITAKNHVAKILAKLDLANRTQLAVWAVRQGL